MERRGLDWCGDPDSLRVNVQLTRSAHSFPPSSLDRRCFMFIVSPKKVVGCRGGNRYVEGDLLTFGYLMLNDSLPSLTIGYLMLHDTLPSLTIG